jgi:hypothetical protein
MNFRMLSLSVAMMIGLLAMAPLARGADPGGTGVLGMNLSGPADWNTEIPFVDVFRFSRRWISQKEDASWGKGPSLELDAQGWVKKLEPNCYAESPVLTIDGGHYPGGRYTLHYDGKGKLQINGKPVKIISDDPGKMVFEVDPMGGGYSGDKSSGLCSQYPADHARFCRILRH